MQQLPEIPPLDVIVGVASAGLLLAALVYLIRSRPEHSLIEVGARSQPAELSLFAPLPSGYLTSRLSFLASLFGHLFGIALIPWLQALYPHQLIFDFEKHDLVVLEYRIPDVPLVAPADLEEEAEPEEPEPEKEKQPEPESSGSPPSPKTEEAREPAESPPPAPALAKAPEKQRPPEKPLFTQRFKIVLPKIATPDPALRDVILRPDLALEFPADHNPKLPPVMEWAAKPRELENALLVGPGWEQPEEPVRWELPEAEPQLLVSNEQPALADLQIADSPVLSPDPALAVPPADVIPFGGVKPPFEPVEEIPSLGEGSSSTTLVILSQNPAPLTPSFLLEMGLQLGTLTDLKQDLLEGLAATDAPDLTPTDISPPEVPFQPTPSLPPPPPNQLAEADTDIASPTASEGPVHQESESNAEQGSNSEAAVEAGLDDGVLAGLGEAPGTQEVFDVLAALTAGIKPRPSSTPFEKGVGTGEKTEESVTAGTSQAGTDSAEIRGSADPDKGNGGARSESVEVAASKASRRRPLKPLPRKKYGIILISNFQTTLVEARGTLTGSPIYTVYLDVPEAPRKWIMQFCLPNSGSRRLDISNGVIRIRPRKKVSPPFAMHMQPLESMASSSAGGRPVRVIIYAVVDEEGILKNFRVVHGSDPETDNVILANLRSWEFLPAFRGDEPVTVEALFGVPLN